MSANGGPGNRSDFGKDKIYSQDWQARRRVSLAEIVSLSKESGEIMFHFRFNGEPRLMLIPARIANVQYPQEVIAFYEQRLLWQNKDGTHTKIELPYPDDEDSAPESEIPDSEHESDIVGSDQEYEDESDEIQDDENDGTEDQDFK